MLMLSDRYCPIRRLGEGGFGVTYLAEDNNRFSKPCVIKQLTLKIPDAQRLFEGEARRLEELAEYPAIPRLLSYYSDTNYLYLVQEFVEGQDLNKELDEKGVFNEVAVKDFLNAILPILEVIHKQGIIHRDIKLDNMMRRSDGKIVLIDFGIAKIIAENNTITPGTRAGTNGYAAPEQMKEGLATPSSDLYSLGAACFYLLTNLSPGNMFMDYGYQWTTNWRQHLKQPIDQKLEAIIEKLLKPNYQDRYQSAAEVLASLNSHALQSAPTAISNDRNVVEKSQKKFTLVQGAILGVIITIGLTIGAFFIAVFCIAIYTMSSVNDTIKAGDDLLDTDKEAAIRKYNKAIEMADYSDDAYAHRGNALFSMGKKQEALKDYNKAIKINSGSSQYYYERGNILTELGDRKGAIKDYDQALKLKSNYPDALNNVTSQ
jgi:serine/threonine protein kinase